MRLRPIVTILLSGFVVASLVALGWQSRSTAPAAPVAPGSVAKPTAEPLPANRVVATYFHGDVRCPTCRKLEALSREAVENGFAKEIAAGTVVFRAVNVDRAENKHFVQDFKLLTKALIVVDERGGQVGRWVNLEKIWDLVGDREPYLAYVRATVQDFLQASAAGA